MREELREWNVVESKLIVDHRFLRVREDLLEHPNDGRRFHCYYLQSPSEAVATVPLTKDGCVILVRQYRHPIGRVIYDLPAGRFAHHATSTLIDVRVSPVVTSMNRRSASPTPICPTDHHRATASGQNQEGQQP